MKIVEIMTELLSYYYRNVQYFVVYWKVVLFMTEPLTVTEDQQALIDSIKKATGTTFRTDKVPAARGVFFHALDIITINVPFDDALWFNVLFHELAHSTMYWVSMEDRPQDTEDEMRVEELLAERVAMLLMKDFGLLDATVSKHSEEYIYSHIKGDHDDRIRRNAVKYLCSGRTGDVNIEKLIPTKTLVQIKKARKALLRVLDAELVMKAHLSQKSPKVLF